MAARKNLQSALLAIAIAANLGLLFYYKYLVALLGFLASAGLVAHEMNALILPLGISFLPSRRSVICSIAKAHWSSKAAY